MKIKFENVKSSVFDVYLAYPIFFDSLLSIILWLCLKYLAIVDFRLIDKSNQLNIFPYIISADVSLAGFILAALTIIVTFKSNLKSKKIEDSENALELIFSSKHYDNIVKVFKNSMIEFILCFTFIFIIWTYEENFSINTINRVNVIGILITSLAIFRSLFILFHVLNLSKYKPE